MTEPAEETGDLYPWEEALQQQATPVAPPPSARATDTESRADRDDHADRADVRGHTERDDNDAFDVQRGRAVAQREYYSISEVCDLVGLKPHVLRYWESQFPPLNPSKNRSGNRVYQRKEIRLIMLVKRLLYEDKYTIDGARARIEQMRRSGKVREMAGRALDLETVAMLRTELEHLRELLTPPA